MSKLIQISLLLPLFTLLGCKEYVAKRTTIKSRKAFREKIEADIIENALKKDIGSINIDELLWATYMFNQQSERAQQVLAKLSRAYAELSEKQRYNFWMAVLVAGKNLNDTILKRNLVEEDNPKVIALASQYFVEEEEFIGQVIEGESACQIEGLKRQLENSDTILFNSLHLRKLIDSELFRGKKHVISFQPQNRNYYGLAIVVDSQGNIITRGDEILVFKQLARSASNVPYYLTNGNSPCGLYSIQGTETSDNVFIGPVPTLQIRMPFEVSTSVFYHREMKSEWSEELYLNNIPIELHEVKQLEQTYRAGKCGRTEIILHGSTIDPEFYLKQHFYPLTPSLGCITSYEKWDEKGKLVESDQRSLVELYEGLPGQHGYFLLANISNSNKNILLVDLQNFIVNKF